MKIKKLLISRHGIKSGKDLVPETIQNLYVNGNKSLAEFISNYQLSDRDIFLWHSKEKRTKYTGEAILAGAKGYKPKPTSQEDLDKFDFQTIQERYHPGLCYSGLDFNLEAMEKYGESAYIEFWNNNPNASTYDGQRITPWNTVRKRSKNCLNDALRNLIKGKKDLGILATHSWIIESLMMEAVSSAKKIVLKNSMRLGDFLIWKSI